MKTSTTRWIGMAVGMAAVPGWSAAMPVHAADLVCDHAYTLDADFDEGTLLNVNHDVPDQLQLNQVTTPFPFVNIACSARGTAVRIDVNTGTILGEYLTAPDGMGRDPSRTTVDKFGNVWVANRAEFGVSGGQDKGSVTRIGLVIGGTRCNADGTPNPAGQYLKPPFLYSTVSDRDGDGLIKTSSGLGNILPWSNAGGADTHGGVSTADDECIINYTRVTGTGTRTVAVDANNDVWVGGLGDLDHEKISGVTGMPFPGTQFNVGAGGYGGLIDGNGVLWSARGGNGLLRYDTTTPVPPNAGNVWSVFGSTRGDYGLGIDPTTGHIWHSGLSGNSLYELDGAGNVLNSYVQPFGAQGVCVDGNGHVWMAEIFGSQVWHLAPDPALPGTHYAVGIVGGFVGTTGVAVDANGKIWAAESADRASRIDPNVGAGPDLNGNFVGAIDLSVPLGAGAGPYNYSDMTGFVSIGATAPSGTWTVIHDSGASGTKWGTICWTGLTPAGTRIKVEVRAADQETDLPASVFQEVQNCVSFCDLGTAGRFIEIRATLSRNASTPESPILYDLTVQCCNRPPVAVCQDVVVCAEPGLCEASVGVLEVDGGSFDPDGDEIVLSISPPGPYPLGDTVVTLTVMDPLGEIDQCDAVVTVEDCEPPLVACVPTTNPSGKNIPKAGANPKSGQNPDGFYELLAGDNCDPEPLIFVADTASDFLAGPYRSGDRVKITQAPGITPSAKPMAGVIVAHIQLKGDAAVVAMDAAGNTTECDCLVPPPPK